MNTYACYYEDCQKIYNSKYNLIRHINAYHLDNKSYMCSFCSKSFYNKQCLTSHLSHRLCDLPNEATVGKGLIACLSNINQNVRQRLMPTPPLSLPVLPRIEKDRQVPFSFAKLPITACVIEQGRRAN